MLSRCLLSLSRVHLLWQTDGGFLGVDSASFFSAVASGAAGFYIVMLLGDAGIGTVLIVTPGQSVSVVGDPSMLAPAWCVR